MSATGQSYAKVVGEVRPLPHTTEQSIKAYVAAAKRFNSKQQRL